MEKLSTGNKSAQTVNPRSSPFSNQEEVKAKSFVTKSGKKITTAAPNFTPSKSSSSFQSGISGDLKRLDGDTYEAAVALLFSRGSNFLDRAYLLFKPRLVMNFYVYEENNGRDKDVDVCFIPRENYDLENLKKLWLGKQILMLGSLKANLKVDTEDKDPFVIPSEALVFVEAKLSQKNLSQALQQQNNNFMGFLHWVKDDMRYKLFKSNNRQFDSNLKEFVKARKEIEVCLIVITNGDSRQLPTQERVIKALNFEEFEGIEPKEKIYPDAVQLKEIFESANQAIEVKDLLVKVKVLFLYVPNYVSNEFLIEYTKMKIQESLDQHKENIERDIIKSIREETNIQLEELRNEQAEVLRQQKEQNQIQVEALKKQIEDLKAIIWQMNNKKGGDEEKNNNDDADENKNKEENKVEDIY